MIRSVRATTLGQFVDLVCDVRRRWTTDSYFDPWFRGQRDASWGLSPSLYRLDLLEDENEIRSEFIRRGAQLIDVREPRTHWEWYFLMQHYGAPTRLLDWTDSALVALFFALNSNRAGDSRITCDAAVWVLDPWWLNGQVIGRHSVVFTDWEEAVPYLPKLFDRSLRKRWPLAIDPPHIARRLAVQRSRFTVHGTDPDGLTTLGKRKRARILKVVIPKKNVLQMRVDLCTCGVTDTTLFPDLEGLARELTRFHSEPWDAGDG